jgi:threonine/homoserine/homoserine lactone efflux protein
MTGQGGGMCISFFFSWGRPKFWVFFWLVFTVFLSLSLSHSHALIAELCIIAFLFFFFFFFFLLFFFSDLYVFLTLHKSYKKHEFQDLISIYYQKYSVFFLNVQNHDSLFSSCR